MSRRPIDADELERRFGDGPGRPVRFPPGEEVLPPMRFFAELLAEVDELLAGGRCAEGRLELETGGARLICLIHRSAPYLCGLVEGGIFNRVPLADLGVRARQLEEPVCRLIRSTAAEVMLMAVHFCQRPELQGSTELVDPEHVLRYLARRRQDAAIAFERGGHRTLLFLAAGRPAHLFFGEPADDPGEGADLEERVLLYAFAPTAPPCRIEVYTELRIEPDPDAGASLVELDASAQPPPPADVVVHMSDGREVRRRPFTAPGMIVGRDPTVDLFIDNLAVSRKHARLFWERGAFVVEDLGSANGTLVEGKPVDRRRLAAGERVQIAKFEIRVIEYDAAPSVSQTMLMPTLGAAVAPAYLVGKGVREALDHDLLIGRGEGVDVRADGLFVRPVHARVSFEEGDSFRLSCFGGGRVRVNDEKVREAELTFGDRIRVGRTELRLVKPRPGRGG